MIYALLGLTYARSPAAALDPIEGGVAADAGTGSGGDINVQDEPGPPPARPAAASKSAARRIAGSELCGTRSPRGANRF